MKNKNKFKLVDFIIVAFYGASGCEKSALMYVLSGIIPRSVERKYKGDVEFLGQNILHMKLSDIVSKIGIVFYNPNSLLFSPTICDEISYSQDLFVSAWTLKRSLSI